MNYVESAYKIIISYTSKKTVVETIVVKNPVEFYDLLDTKARYESDPDALSVELVRTRKPKTYNYGHYETPVMVDDSGTVTTEAEKSLMFKPTPAAQAAGTLIRTDQQKADWARTYKHDDRTCLWH